MLWYIENIHNIEMDAHSTYYFTAYPLVFTLSIFIFVIMYACLV